jgi:hypothetical protein
MEPEMTACEPLSINGIQEVSGSIPLISTITRDVKYRKSPETARFRDFFVLKVPVFDPGIIQVCGSFF